MPCWFTILTIKVDNKLIVFPPKNLTSEKISKFHLHSTHTKQKRCYDITQSRQEGSMIRNLVTAQYMTSPARGDTGQRFSRSAG